MFNNRKGIDPSRRTVTNIIKNSSINVNNKNITQGELFFQRRRENEVKTPELNNKYVYCF